MMFWYEKNSLDKALSDSFLFIGQEKSEEVLKKNKIEVE